MVKKICKINKVCKPVGKNIELLDGNTAIAFAMKLCRVKSFPCFPITPQTELIHLIADWKAEEKIDLEFNQVDSEHSVFSAALGSEMTETRTLISSGSQGLMLGHELLPIIAGTRMPLVYVNGSRALSAPIQLWADHNDVLSCRDFGWLITITENNQELLDSIIMAFKISENPTVQLPSLVNMDGFVQSNTRTNTVVPEQKIVDKFLPKLKLQTKLDVKKPMSLGVPAMEEYIQFKSQMHKTLLDSKKIIKKTFADWKKLTGREYDFFEKYSMNNASTVIVMVGPNSLTAKTAIDNLRKKGKNVGLLRLRVIRPFPIEELKVALKGAKKIAVIDQNISLGQSGILYQEVKAALCNENKKISNFIIGLGGYFVSVKDFENIFNAIMKSEKELKAWIM